MHTLRWNELDRLLARADIVCLQEAHSAEDDAEILHHGRMNSHHLAFSPGPSRDAGGVAIWVARSLAPDPPTMQVIQPGRELAVRFVSSQGDVFRVANIHNFEVSSRSIRKVARLAASAATCCSEAFFLLGD